LGDERPSGFSNRQPSVRLKRHILRAGLAGGGAQITGASPCEKGRPAGSALAMEYQNKSFVLRKGDPAAVLHG